jgi:hypothetical protein
MPGMRLIESQWFRRHAHQAPAARLRRHHPGVRRVTRLEALEGRTLLSYLTITSIPDNITAEIPFDLTAEVHNDDGTLDTSFDGSFDATWESFWDNAHYGDLVGSSVQIQSVSNSGGVSTITMVVDPAPSFRISLSAIVPDPSGGAGTSIGSAQFDLPWVNTLPDQLAFLQPPPDSIDVGSPFNVSVAALAPSGEIDTSFHGLVILGGIDGRTDMWGGYPPIDGQRFVYASGGVATFTDLSVSSWTDSSNPGQYGLWSPDLTSTLSFTTHAIGSPALVWATPPDRGVIVGQPFSVAARAMDRGGNDVTRFNGDVTIALAGNPTDAHLGGTLTVTAVDGVALFSDLTIDKPGMGYALQVTSPGLDSVGGYAFNVQTTVDTAGVGWGTQVAPLVTASDGLRLLPEGRNTDLPWLDIRRVQVSLGQAVPLDPVDVTVHGSGGRDYGPVTVSGSATDYTIVLAHPIETADRVVITIGNTLLARFERRLDVLPGDVNDDGIVNAQDMVLVRNRIQDPSDPLRIGWFNLDGYGKVNIDDLMVVRRKLGTHL